MSLAALDGLKPRKTPRQARSQATLDAVYQATVQVLLTDGGQHLTTMRVAERSGASVGAMRQYFPRKRASLYAVLQRRLDLTRAALWPVSAEPTRSVGEIR